MAHYPKRRRWPFGWLPDRCACGARRYDRCPDAIADAISGSGAPRAAVQPQWPTNRPRHEGDDPQSRVGRW